MIKYLIILNLSLLLIHEMDAIRRKEWNMFIFLKDIDEEKAYTIFSIVHLPIFMLILYFVGIDNLATIHMFGWVISIFSIFHGIIHWLFRKKKSNNFDKIFSKIIVYSMSVVAIINIIFLVK